MRAADRGSSEPSRVGCIFALALILVPGIVSSVLRGPVGEDWPFALFYGFLLAVPFAYLGLDGTRDRIPWLVAVVLSCLFWGALIVSVIVSAREQSGVNFGMGLVMLASPFVITAAAWACNRQAD